MSKGQRFIGVLFLYFSGWLGAGLLTAWLVLGPELGAWLKNLVPLLILYVTLISIPAVFLGIIGLKFYDAIREVEIEKKMLRELRNDYFILLIIFTFIVAFGYLVTGELSESVLGVAKILFMIGFIFSSGSLIVLLFSMIGEILFFLGFYQRDEW